MILRIAAAAALVAAAGAAFACSCRDISRAKPPRLADFLARADRVVHARVAERLSPTAARIEVIESFKGTGERLESLAGDGSNCGFTFVPGEERVYFVFAGVVNLCGRAAPRPQLIAQLRRMKSAMPQCGGVPQPPRPAPVEALKEADPAPYEPLDGSDPEVGLGVGHVRPARDDERDEWTRRLVLPLFSSPAGELKTWLTPGAVGADVLVETGYETASFIVLRAQPDGWLQIRFGGPLASGAGWVHLCHLEAATPRLAYEPWERLLAASGSLYFRSQTPRRLRKGPSFESAVVADIPADPNAYGIKPLEFRGAWARVRLSIPSAECGDPKAARAAVREGWLRWRNSDRSPALWYYPRGC